MIERLARGICGGCKKVIVLLLQDQGQEQGDTLMRYTVMESTTPNMSKKHVSCQRVLHDECLSTW